MKGIFKAIPRENADFREILRPLFKQEDFRKYILDNVGNELIFTIDRSADKNEKIRMYSYFNGVVVPAYVKVKQDIGELISKADAILELKIMFLRDVYVDSKGEEHVYVKSQSDLTKPEYVLFLQQVLMYLEVEYGMLPPDSERYIEAKVSEDLKRVMWTVK